MSKVYSIRTSSITKKTIEEFNKKKYNIPKDLRGQNYLGEEHSQIT